MIADYVDRLAAALLAMRATAGTTDVPADEALERVCELLSSTAILGAGCVFFIGNGGSAALASHCAADFARNASVRAFALTESAALTCVGNDLAFDMIFASQVELHGRHGDVLMAISCSGESPNIVRAIPAARQRGMTVITLTGFDPTNTVRAQGDINFWIRASDYGVVETAHTAIAHVILDGIRKIRGTADRSARRDTYREAHARRRAI